jgi:hypothetical protein
MKEVHRSAKLHNDAIIRDQSQSAADYWQNFLDLSVGGETSTGRMINNLATNSFEAMARVFPESKAVRKLANDKRFASRLSNTIARMGYWHYLGFKPSSAIRNLTQINLAMSELGMGYAAKAAHAITAEGGIPTVMRQLKDLGIITEYAPHLETEGIKSGAGRMLDRATKVSMYMFSTADAINRMMTYKAAEMRFKDTIKDYGERIKNNDIGAIREAQRKLLLVSQRIGGKYTEKQSSAIRREVTQLMRNGKFDEAAVEYGRHFVDKWQFRYGKLGSPSAIQNPFGRLFMQFATWPSFYAHSMGKEAIHAAKGDKQSIKTLASWLIQSNMIALAGTHLAGLDLTSWFSGDKMETQFTLNGEEFTVGAPTAALGISTGPAMGPIVEAADYLIGFAAGDDYRTSKYSKSLAQRMTNPLPLIPALGTDGLLNVLDAYLTTGASSKITDKYGNTVRWTDWKDKIKMSLGLRPQSFTDTDNKANITDDIRREAAETKKAMTIDVRRALQREPWAMRANPSMVSAFIRKNFPGATHLLNKTALNRMIDSITKDRVTRRDQSTNKTLRGILEDRNLRKQYNFTGR